jgi:GR25 family glycosyltransferase involved in LPS biosynthesis
MIKFKTINIIVIIIIFSILLILLQNIISKNYNNNYIKKLSIIHNKLYNLDINENKRIQDSYKINIPIYYINLERSIDRNNYMKEQLKKYYINAKRIEAIDGQKIDMNKGVIKLNDYIYINYINNYKNCSLYELACTLSHLKAIYNAYMDNVEYALIIEDDISFALLPFWNFKLTDIFDRVPKDWNIISLFGIECTNMSKDIYVSFKDKICYSCCGYIINRKGMINVLNDIINLNIINLDPDNIELNSKSIVADILLYYRSRNTYNYVEYPIIYPYNDDKIMNSTIHTDHTIYQVKKTLKYLEKYKNI